MSKDASLLTLKKQGFTIYENLLQKQEQNNRNTSNFIQRINGTNVGAGNPTGSLITNQAVGATVYGEFFQTPRIRLPNQDLPFVNSLSFSTLNNSTLMIFTGDVTGSNNSAMNDAGIVWNTTGNPTLNDNVVTADSNFGLFSVTYNNNTSTFTNYARAYARNTLGVKYGTVLTATPFLDPVLPTVTTNSFTSVNNNTSMTVTGTVTNYGTSPVTQVGVVWLSTPVSELPPLPTFQNAFIEPATLDSNGNFSKTFFTGLTTNTTIPARAYAVNTSGIAYGNQLTATTQFLPELPQMSSVSISTFNINSGIRFTGKFDPTFFNRTPTSYGVVWSTDPDPTISDNLVARFDLNNPPETYSIQFATNNSNTIYARAYGSNGAGESYAPTQFQINPLFPITAPFVSFPRFGVLPNTSNTFDLSGTIDNSGNSTVTTQGFVYKQLSNISDFLIPPTIESSSNIEVGFTPPNYIDFFATLFVLSTGFYSARAYASNGAGISYSSNVLSSFITCETVFPFTELNIYSAGANVNSRLNFEIQTLASNGSPMTSTGIVYSFVPYLQSGDPLPSLCTTNGIISPDADSYIGYVSSSVLGFQANEPNLTTTIISSFQAVSIYATWARAFAVNQTGIGYGSNILSATPFQLPVLGPTNIYTIVTQVFATMSGLSNIGSGSFFETGIVILFGSSGTPIWTYNSPNNRVYTNYTSNSGGPYNGYSDNFTPPSGTYRMRFYWTNRISETPFPGVFRVGYGNTFTVSV